MENRTVMVQYSSCYNMNDVFLLESQWRQNKCQCLKQHIKEILTLLCYILPKDCAKIVIDNTLCNDIHFNEIIDIKTYYDKDTYTTYKKYQIEISTSSWRKGEFTFLE